jgi:hypothetical protein
MVIMNTDVECGLTCESSGTIYLSSPASHRHVINKRIGFYSGLSRILVIDREYVIYILWSHQARKSALGT